MSAIDRILGEAMDEWQQSNYDNPLQAYVWSILQRQRFPEAEPYIAKHPTYGKLYLDLFPDAEDDWRMNGWLEGEWV